MHSSTSSHTRHDRQAALLVGFFHTGTVLSTALVLGSAGFVLSNAFTGASLAKVPGHLWWLIIIGILGAAVCSFAEITTGAHAARTEEKRLRERLLRAFFTIRLTGSSKTPPARFISLMTDATERATEFRQVYLPAALAALLSPVLILLYVTALDPLTGISILVVIPLIPATLWVFFRFFRKVSGQSRARREKLTVSYLDALKHLSLIRLYNAGERTEESLRERGEQNRQAVMRLLAANQLVIVVMDSVFLLVLICWSVLVISSRVQAGALDKSQALSALLLLPLLLEPLSQVAGFFYIGMGGRASQRAIAGVLGAPQPRQRRVQTSTGFKDDALSVCDLTHDFGSGQVLKNLTFNVCRGEKVAILGASGAGKSTLLNLVHGTLSVQQGKIEITGCDIASLEPEQVPQQSALVTQHTHLFSGTVAENLRLAREDASEELLWQVLQQAQLDGEIQALSAGLATEVGENGSKLSGGQAQRLSLARALLANRKLLLLDEPTSQLDPVSEQKLVTALSTLNKDISLVMVTHRRALLEIADTVYTLESGTLTEARER